jgi:hypothetical protein
MWEEASSWYVMRMWLRKEWEGFWVLWVDGRISDGGNEDEVGQVEMEGR